MPVSDARSSSPPSRISAGTQLRLSAAYIRLFRLPDRRLTVPAVESVGRERPPPAPRACVQLGEGVVLLDIDDLRVAAEANRAGRAVEARRAEIIVADEVARCLRPRRLPRAAPHLASAA